MKVTKLQWLAVIDNWRLATLGDEGSGRPATPGRGQGLPPDYRTIPMQCRDWVESLDGFPAIRADLRGWALKGDRLTDDVVRWIRATLIPKVGTGLAVLPPALPEPPTKEKAETGGSLRERGRRR